MRQQNRHFLNRLHLWLLFLLIIAGGAVLQTESAYAADCLPISDIPLQVVNHSPPGLIMFSFDNSGSMDWTLMTPDEEGVFYINTRQGQQDIEYVFPEDRSGAWNVLPDGYRMLWKSQWSGYNRMYYNPSSNYTPWPRWNEVGIAQNPPAGADADPDTPRDRPQYDTTVNMNQLYTSYSSTPQSGSIGLDAVIETSAVIVDNEDTSTNTDMIMDDGDTGYRFADKLETYSGSWHQTDDSNYNKDYDRVLKTEAKMPATATYTFDIKTAGKYKVYVTWNGYETRSTAVQYEVFNSSSTKALATMTIDQTQSGYNWTSLGEYDFDQGPGGAKIVITFNGVTGCPSKGDCSFSADAVKLVPSFTGSMPSVHFSSTGPWSPSSSVDAYRGTYLYSNTKDDPYTATWTASNLDPNQKYAVYVWWRYVEGARSSSVDYEITSSTATLPVTMDQSDASLGSQWNLLATGLTFGDGTGIVKLLHTPTDPTTDRVCVDAVAFLPISAIPSGDLVTSLDITYAHYYVHNAAGTFLVNLNGGIQYYRVMDANHNDNVDGGELLTMTADEAAAKGIVTGRTYAQERQNFANWFEFYRRRDYAARNAIAQVVVNMSNVYIGMRTFPERNNYPVLPINVTYGNQTPPDETNTVLAECYGMPFPSGDSPMRKGLVKIGEYFENAKFANFEAPPVYADDSTNPFFTSENGGDCQQAFTILMTDGAYNGSGPNMENADGDCDSNFDCGKFGDNYEDTLADVAMYYYERDLKPMLENYVPTNYLDDNDAQHMVTYAVSFGVNGTIDPGNYPDCPKGDCPVWPDPSNGPENRKLDDVYHATVNGRGLYLSAANPEELIQALMVIKHDIEMRLGSAAAVATNSVQRQVGTNLYQGKYNSEQWSGNLIAVPVNVVTGQIEDSIWEAADKLNKKKPDDRVIFTYNGSAGIPFRYTDLSATQKSELDINPTIAQDMVSFLRGDHSNEQINGGTFRTRDGALGDIVHSEPVYNDDIVYIGANDGMLHAFDASTGTELFAYVPNLVFANLVNLTDPDYSHKYYVDATPYVKAVSSTETLLAGGLGKGGKGVYCLDVTNAMTADESKAAQFVKWEYPAAGTTDADMGYTFGHAFIVNTKAAGWVVMTGNGYDSDNQEAILYVFDAENGNVVKKIPTGVSNCNGLSDLALIDYNVDGKIDYGYAGDLHGNLWKFDFTGDTVDDWKIAYSDGTNPQPIFQARNAAGDEQPITSAPDVMRSCDLKLPGYIVVFGTGIYLNEGDFITTGQQSIYGIYDWQEAWVAKENSQTAGDDKYLGYFTTDRRLSNLKGNWSFSASVQNLTLLQQIATFTSADTGKLTNFPSDYYNVNDNAGTHVGWYIDLPESGERVIRDPMIRAGQVVVVSSIPSQSPCAGGGSSNIYLLDACTGGGNGLPSGGENKYPDITHVDQWLFRPVELSNTLYINDSTGKINLFNVPPQPLGMSYWREIEFDW